MAYNDAAANVIHKHMCPVFGLPGVISQVVNNSATEANVLIDIPWKSCKLVACYSTVTTRIDSSTGGMAMKLELNANGGTEMMAGTPAAADAIGTQTAFTVTSAAACNNLDRDDTSRDKINIQVDGGTTGTGQVMLHMYFEPISNP
jgi:hypothetical protein